MEEQKKPPEGESVDYSGAKKPWFTVLLLIAIPVLWYDNKAKDDKIEAKNAELIKVYKDQTLMAIELNKAQERLLYQQERFMGLTNDSIRAVSGKRGDAGNTTD